MNTLTTVLGTKCHFYTIAELTNSLRELVVSAASLTEAETMAKDLDYQYFLVEPYDLELPLVATMPKKTVSNGMPHSLQVQAI